MIGTLYTPPALESIEETAAKMVAMSKRINGVVVADFNGCALICNRATTDKMIIDAFFNHRRAKGKKAMGSPAYDQCVVDALRALVNKIDLEASEGHPLHPMNYPEHTWGIDGYPDELERAREILREIDANA